MLVFLFFNDFLKHAFFKNFLIENRNDLEAVITQADLLNK